jgi:hypothetical protein
MPLAFDKTMFEIYREAPGEGQYKVVYFTELDDHNKEEQIARAMRGEHVYDGFLRNYGKAEAKKAVARILDRLNRGEGLVAADIQRELQPYME